MAWPHQLISQRDSTGNRYFIFDEPGNTVLRLDDNRNVKASGFFEAYGLPVPLTNTYPSTDADPYDGYKAQAGHYHGPITGAYLCGFRFNDPFQARWLTRDPVISVNPLQ